MNEKALNKVLAIAQRFSGGAAVLRARPHGTGRVNATYLVETTAPAPCDCFILQQISRQVFPEPERIMANLRRLASHVAHTAPRLFDFQQDRWEIPLPIPSADGADWTVDAAGGFWRALTLIRNAAPLDAVRSPRAAAEAGRALGLFHAMAATLPPSSLFDTLPGFHVTPRYLALYDMLPAKEALQAHDASRARFCSSFIEARRRDVDLLEQARREGRAIERVIHGDPKSSNIMVDAQTARAVGIVDLDTVKPGLVLCDIGDCLRSCCNQTGEDAADPAAVRFDIRLCADVLQGYLQVAGELLLPSEVDLIAEAVRLIAFELGLRYFSDYLSGNIYFRTPKPDGNLRRALVQFHLVLDIERQLSLIRQMVLETVHGKTTAEMR